MITPPIRTSKPLYKIGLLKENARECDGVGSLTNIRTIDKTINGTSMLLRRRIFSIPRTTTTPPKIVIASPSARGTPVMEYMI